MFHFILKNPICSVLTICLLFLGTAGIFFYSEFLKIQDIQYCTIVTIIIFLCTNTMYRLTAIVFALIVFLIYLLLPFPIFLLVGEVTLLVFAFWQNKTEKKALSFLILALGFLFHLYYVQNSTIDQRQHDLTGVLYYMQMITKNGINWQNFDPWYMYYFFHQPFHFITAGYLYLLDYSLWHSAAMAQESLQYLSLFYTTTTTIVAAKIFSVLDLPKKLYYSALILFTFNPTLFLFSGYVADDTPVLFWTILFIYFLIRWTHSGRFIHLFGAALCFGLGTLTKLSILVLVPTVCILFLYKIYSSAQKKQILTGINLFIITVVPIALLWIVRNHILFDMPFYNIPDTSPSGQNFKYLSFVERITTFSSVFKPFIHSPFIVESNIWLALIKTELFGEWNLSIGHSFILIPSLFLYLINILFKISAGIGGLFLFYHFCKKSYSLQYALFCFFIITYYVIWIYAFKYAMDYPYACSTDYRLFSTLILPEIIVLIALANKLKFANILLIASMLYGILTSFIYIAIA